jgi:hypothetical protein
VTEWNFLTNQAQALLCVARDPGTRLRDIAATLGITERRAFGIVTDLADAGYVVKARDGRRNRYEIQHHLPLPDQVLRERTVGELLELLAKAKPDPHTAPGVVGEERGSSTHRTGRRAVPHNDMKDALDRAADDGWPNGAIDSRVTGLEGAR